MKPNVIVFFTDQQRWDCSGLHGNPLDLMPNFDRLAREGTHIAQAFTCQPVCGPARSCLQTGMYATQTGCFVNGIPLPSHLRTLAHSFNDAGYHTGYIGKWHLADTNIKGPVREEQRGGYQEWLAANALEHTSEAYDLRLYDNHGVEHQFPGYRVDAQTDAAIRFISKHRDKPFFLFNSYLEPHHQNARDDYPAPEGYEEKYRGRWIPPDLAELIGSTHRHLSGYYGMVKRLDEAFGRLLDALTSLGLRERTIILFTSDHGCHFKTRNAEYKRSCHDASIRVPMALSGPGFAGGGQVGQPVSLVDLPPTVLEAVGITPPKSMQGRSILPLLHRNNIDWPGEVFVQISEREVGRAIRTSRWKYSVNAPERDPWKEMNSDVYREAFLYDLRSDPYELTNLVNSASHQAVREELRAVLLRRIVEAGEPRPRILPFSTS